MDEADKTWWCPTHDAGCEGCMCPRPNAEQPAAELCEQGHPMSFVCGPDGEGGGMHCWTCWDARTDHYEEIVI